MGLFDFVASDERILRQKDVSNMARLRWTFFIGILLTLSVISQISCEEEEKKAEEPAKEEEVPPKVDQDPGKSRDGAKTDDEVVEREEEAIKLDGLNVAQMKELREKMEKHQ